MSQYRFPKGLLLRIALAVLLGRKRSLGDDSAAGLRGAWPPPVALGTEHIPRRGPFVVVGNHYERPGLWVGWGVMVVNAMVRATGERPRDLHWLMVAELLDFRLGRFVVPRAWVRAVFVRFARSYEFGLVTPRETGAVGSPAGLRAIARWLAAGEPVGVLPEGTASEALREARPGSGAFLAWLTRDGIPLVPVGIAERNGVLTATFGPPFCLPRVDGDKTTRDRILRDTVMVAIGRLLPPALWGYYRPLLERGGADADSAVSLPPAEADARPGNSNPA
ncbi:MAG TPA: 1-acyl-sn-glycerol-3-phosphate acyltransferase [Chloroflexota bacterium]|nr:1-acyl-sn-glycerol-3-phosphate acyltransferase [Chloroflexota bacterium]